MGASGSRATDEINLDEFERRLRAAGAQQARAEDPLAELTRLVEFSHMGISNGEATARRVPEPPAARAGSHTSIENAAPRPTIDEELEELAPGGSEADRQARQDYEFNAQRSDGAYAAAPDEGRRSRRWTLAVSGLALAGVAMIGAVFALKSGVPGLPKQPPFIAAAQGPTKVAPPSDETVIASNDAGGSLLKDNAKPGSVKVINSEEQPVDLNAQVSLGNPPSSIANPPAAADPAKPPSGASDATSLAATVNTPLVPPPATPPVMSPEFPDPKPVRTVSLRPDGTPIAAANPPDQGGSDAKSASAPTAAPSKPAEAPFKAASKTASDATGAAQPSTPKLDLPAKPSAKSSARVEVAKTDTTAPEPNAQTPSEPAQSGAPPKPEKAAKKPKAAQVATDTTGAIAQPPVDATAATTSGGWSVQLAAPKSEAEADSELTRLTSKYGAELNGSPIGVHKAVVNGETIYRLRVVGLTKADAAALCARLKGEGGACFIAK
jgi:SPOR domain